MSNLKNVKKKVFYTISVKDNKFFVKRHIHYFSRRYFYLRGKLICSNSGKDQFDSFRSAVAVMKSHHKSLRKVSMAERIKYFEFSSPSIVEFYTINK